MNGGLVILARYGSEFTLCPTQPCKEGAKENVSLQSLTLTRRLNEGLEFR